jgi:periplasmic protein TonB
MDRRQKLLRRLPIIVGGVAMVLMVAGFVFVVYRYATNKDVKAERKVQVVQLIRPPPPPPDQPPPPPPPEKVDEALPQDEPEPSPSDAPAPSEQLGLDTEGGAGGDAFGLAARKGGHDLTGGGGAIFAWYTTRLKDVVAEKLADDSRIRSKRFSVAVKVWIEADGRVREARLASSTGNHELDSAIETALGKLPRMSEPPPIEMPQPISLKIVSST